LGFVWIESTLLFMTHTKAQLLNSLKRFLSTLNARVTVSQSGFCLDESTL
jgi:hypothetical protein